MELLSLYTTNLSEYQKKAREEALKTAKPTPEGYMCRGTEIDDVSDFSVTLTEDEKVPPYMRSQVTGRYIPVADRVYSDSGQLWDRREYEQIIATRSPLGAGVRTDDGDLAPD
jgi:hypothetical protein